MAKTAIQQIISALAKQYNLSAAEAAAFVDAFFDIVSSELKNGNQVKIKGLGTFKVQAVKPRESVNVNTGERVLIEGHDKISFTPDTVMKELVNKPFSQFETVVINDGVNTEELERIPAEESSDDVKEEIANELSTENISKEENTVSKEEKTPVEAFEKQKEELTVQKEEATVQNEEKEGVAEHTSAKEDTVIEADDSLIEKNLPIDVIEEPSSINEEETVASSEETFVQNSIKEETQDVSSLVEEKSIEVEQKPVEVEVKPVEAVQTVTNVSEEHSEPLKEEVIAEVQQAKNSEPTHTSIDEDNDVEGSENGMLKKVALIAFIVIVCLGIFLWARMGSSNSSKHSKEVAEQMNADGENSSLGTKTVSADTIRTALKVQKAPEKKDVARVDSFVALNSDPRIRYGAYNIIGIDRVVVLKKGETMEKFSRKTLGADMVGYFQVLNGRKSMQAGDTMKVPKVELRPEYRK